MKKNIFLSLTIPLAIAVGLWSCSSPTSSSGNSGGTTGNSGTPATTYNVAYNANGGTGTVPSDTAQYANGATVTVLGQQALSNSPNSFAGWTTNTATTGSSSSYAAASTLTINNASVQLYAVWLPSVFTSSASGGQITVTGYTSNGSSYSIPPGVTALGNGTTSLAITAGISTINLPSSVTSISAVALENSTNLTTITLPGVTSIGANAFSGDNGLTSVTLPSGLLTIAASGFINCSALTGITIPSTVTSIGDNAFKGNSALVSVLMKSATPPTLGLTVFSGANASLNIHVPSASAVTAYQADTNWSALTIVTP